MNEKYQPLPVGRDLSLVSLEAALGQRPKFTLYVHAHLYPIAQRLVVQPEVVEERMQVVIDPELVGEHAWYITAAVGSKGP
jgi:hypothetical protein